MGLFILWKTSEISNLLLSRLYPLGWSIQRDKHLKSNLTKSPKLSYLALNPENNKQNVPLAFETTITAAQRYFSNCRVVGSFLEIFNTWWTISNSKERFSPNILRNAVINGTKNWVFKSSGKLDWTHTSNCVCIDYYSSCPCCAHTRLTEAYQYVITVRMQSDPVKRRFSQYRQMSGGRFLNNLREVLNSKRILLCRSLIKENKVTTGYVAKKVIKRSHCESDKILLKAGEVWHS